MSTIFSFIFICCTVCIVFRRYIYLILSTWVCFERASSPSHLFTHANRSPAHIVCEHGTRGAHCGGVQCIKLYLFFTSHTISPSLSLFFEWKKSLLRPLFSTVLRLSIGVVALGIGEILYFRERNKSGLKWKSNLLFRTVTTHETICHLNTVNNRSMCEWSNYSMNARQVQLAYSCTGEWLHNSIEFTSGKVDFFICWPDCNKS